MDTIVWEEVRDHEVYFVTGEWTTDGWRFLERSTWEVRWYPVSLARYEQCLDQIKVRKQRTHE